MEALCRTPRPDTRVHTPRAAAAAEKTYVYIFGDRVPHFHVNLAPHRAGDALRGGPGLVDPGAPDAALTAHQAVAAAARAALARQ